MSQLSYLDMSGAFTSCLPTFKDGSQYSALTASSQLCVLKLSKCKVKLQQAWQYMFSQHSKRPALQQLQQLQLGSADDDSCIPKDSKLTNGSLYNLMDCWPGLQDLDVSGALGPFHHVKELNSFTQLTALAVTGASAADVSYLTGLHGLRSLRLIFPRKTLKPATLPLAGPEPQRQEGALQHLRGSLQQLSALAALTRLEAPGVLQEAIIARGPGC
jgi:hypothetical protein